MKKGILLLALCAFGATAVAQDQPAEKTEIPQDAVILSIAGPLAQYGYANADPLPLIQAAEILNQVSNDNVAREKTTEKADATAGEKTTGVVLDPSKLLADAEALAEGNETILALINEARNSATRGATSDYAPHYDSVLAYDTDYYKVQFRGGERAIVIVNGDGDTDLDVYVYNSNGVCVASDTDNTDYCVCAWTPSYTQTYTIKIVNYGSVYNRYCLRVN